VLNTLHIPPDRFILANGPDAWLSRSLLASDMPQPSYASERGSVDSSPLALIGRCYESRSPGPRKRQARLRAANVMLIASPACCVTSREAFLGADQTCVSLHGSDRLPAVLVVIVLVFIVIASSESSHGKKEHVCRSASSSVVCRLPNVALLSA